jgi:hypothetical protein
MTQLDFEKTAMIIGLDFDGTMIFHSFPTMGEPIPTAFEWVGRWVAEGARIMLWTNRSHKVMVGRDPLQEALDLMDKHGIPLWGVNENPEQDWSDSPKAFAHLFVDDAALGCPLVHPPGRRPHVNWAVVGPQVLLEIYRWNRRES